MAEIDNTNETILNNLEIENSLNNYAIQTVNTDDILNSLKFHTIQERALVKSIIENLEEDIATGFKEGLIVAIPNIGTLWKDKLPEELRKRNKELWDKKHEISKEEFIEYVKDVRRDIKNQIKEDANKRKILNKTKYKFKKKYNELVVSRGKEYADVYICALLWLKPIDYNQEVQDQYDKIYGIYEE